MARLVQFGDAVRSDPLADEAVRLACRVVQLMADLDREGAPPGRTAPGPGQAQPALSREAGRLGLAARKLAAGLENVAVSLRSLPRRKPAAPRALAR